MYFLRRAAPDLARAAFRGPWAAHLAWYVRGYTADQAEPAWEWAVERFLSRYWRTDIRRVLDEHRAAGDAVMLVSAAPMPLVERIAAEVGAQHAVGTRFEMIDGRFSGRAIPPIVIDEGKAAAAQAALRALDLSVDLPSSSAYANSVTDLPLLEMVGRPAAVYPDAHLRAIAEQRGWRIFPK